MLNPDSDGPRSLSAEARATLEAKRLVFTVTTGRSGTNYLAAIAGMLPGVTSQHEPSPNFIEVFRRLQLGGEPGLARRWWSEVKLPVIARHPGSVYVETSNVFGKGFLEPLLELGFVPDLVLLSRSRRAIALSMFRLDTIPGRALLSDLWYSRPDDPGVLSMPGWEQMHDYQLCYWYTLEMARRQDAYEPLIEERGGRTWRVTLDELATRDGFDVLSHFLIGRPPPLMSRLRFRRHMSRRFNQKDAEKQSRGIAVPDDLDALEREVYDVTGVAPALAPRGVAG